MSLADLFALQRGHNRYNNPPDEKPATDNREAINMMRMLT